MKTLTRTLTALLFVASAAAWFVLGTLLMDELPKVWLVAAAALLALVITLASSGAQLVRPKAMGLRTMLAAVIGGVLTVFFAPLLLFANRLTDAPPGSEVIFFTTAGWALLAVLSGLITRDKRSGWSTLAFVLVGVVGVAATVANWERPSSFSPFVRYPTQDLGLLLAGGAWVGGIVLLSRLGRDASERRTAWALGTGAGAIVAVTNALVSAGSVRLELVPWGTVFALGVSFGVMLLSWLVLAEELGNAKPASLLIAVPAAVMALAVYEQSVSPKGPDPVVWAGAVGGLVLSALAIGGVWLVRHGSLSWRPRASRALSALALVIVLLGAFSLIRPAFDASVQGSRSTGEEYEAQWTMLGYESAIGWVPLLAGGLLLAGSTGLDMPERRFERIYAGVATLVMTACYPLLVSTPLHTWNRWIPAEIQSEYGTEYALLQMTAVHEPLRLLALALSAVGALMLVISSLSRAEVASIPVEEQTR